MFDIDMEALFMGIVMSIVGLLTLVVVYMFLVVMPVGVYAEAECLEHGYPKAIVTYKLDVYCTNLEGSVTVGVDALSELED